MVETILFLKILLGVLYPMLGALFAAWYSAKAREIALENRLSVEVVGIDAAKESERNSRVVIRVAPILMFFFWFPLALIEGILDCPILRLCF